MSNVSIYEKKWLDVVFEGKNQLYGAYQLRLQNPRTTLNALLLGTLLFGSVLAMAVLSRNVIQTEPTLPAIDDDPIVLVNIRPPMPPVPKTTAVPPARKENQTKREQAISSSRYVPAPETESVEVIQSTSQSTVASQGSEGIGNTAPDSANSGTATTEVTPVNTAMLDKLPEFPGGIDKFLRYVGDNFKKPELDEAKTVRVIMSFVIEKDGTMTEIKVLKNPGYGLDKEAIRVLKSQKTKWKPGVRNGQTVRTLYTLPISISAQ